MEMVFLVSIGIAAFFALILLGAGVRSLLRRGESEVGGWELRGGGRRIRAVASSTLAEGLRMRVALVFLLVMVVAIPTLAATGEGDGTILGRVQMFIGYAFGFSSFLLAVLTIILSTRSLSAEIAGRQIFGTVSKPIPRWQVIAGKWLGITALNVVMLAFAVFAAYAGVRYLVWDTQHRLQTELVSRGGLTEPQAAGCLDSIRRVRGPGGIGVDSPIIPAMADALGWSNEQVTELLLLLPDQTKSELRRLDQVRRHVLAARASVRPKVRDVTQAVKARLAELRERGEVTDEDEHRARRELFRVHREAQRSVGPFRVRPWVLQGPPPVESDEFLVSVRFKLEGFTPPAVSTEGMLLQENTLLGQWRVGDPESPSAFFWPESPQPKPLSTFVEFEIPSHVIDEDGVVRIEFANVDPRRVTARFAPNGLEVLYAAGSFEGNLIRAAVAMLMPLMVLAAAGVCFSTFCTFPVAFLVTLTLYAAASTSGFLYEAVGVSDSVFSLDPTTVDLVRKWIADVVFKIVSISTLDAPDRLVEGRLVSWGDLSTEALHTLVFRCGPFLATAVFIFRRRELAAIIV
ncbi:MAG: ABC transporter permease [Phycisphaerae bacterium]